jgi:Glycosyltransferases involved in cell wall biogenesis
MNKHMFAVCAYKESPYLEECILSLKNQSTPSPVIVCTSTPNPQIETLCQRYALRLSINKGSGGIDGDWNDTLAEADAEYVTLCHQDDIYEPLYSEKIKREIERNDEHLILFTDYMELKNGKKVAGSKLLNIKRLLLWPLYFKPFQGLRFMKRMALRFGNAICCPSVTYHRTILPLPLFEKKFKSNLDWQTWEKLSKQQGTFTYIRQKLMCHRIHEESTTSELIRDNQRTAEDEAVFRLFWPKGIAKALAKIYASSEKENNSGL